MFTSTFAGRPGTQSVSEQVKEDYQLLANDHGKSFKAWVCLIWTIVECTLQISGCAAERPPSQPAGGSAVWGSLQWGKVAQFFNLVPLFFSFYLNISSCVNLYWTYSQPRSVCLGLADEVYWGSWKVNKGTYMLLYNIQSNEWRWLPERRWARSLVWTHLRSPSRNSEPTNILCSFASLH